MGIVRKLGCRKSTLLRQLAVMEFLDEGEMFINEIKLSKNNIKKYQEDIGYVFQKYNLSPYLSLRDNILLILTKVKKIDDKKANDIADGLINRVYLYNQRDKKPNKVSEGQAQRASIARALSTNPSLIFVDDPIATLDPILTSEVLGAIRI